MKVVYHPSVQRDVNGILRHYDAISTGLGDAFWDELMVLVQAAAQSPERYRLFRSVLRRVNQRRFPYHFLFRIIPGGIRVVGVRHHRRHPDYGIERS